MPAPTEFLLTDDIVWSFVTDPVCVEDSSLSVVSVTADCSGKFPRLVVRFADGGEFRCERCKPRYVNNWLVTQVYA